MSHATASGPSYTRVRVTVVSDLIDTTEMYLRTIYELEEENIPPLRARIAERLHHSGPTVSQTVARMERDGLLTVTDTRQIQLSAAGRERAIAVMRKHRLVERLLIDVIGLDWNLVHDEACRWEHVVSEHVEERLVAILEDTSESPYGNPIPGLEELGVAPNAMHVEGLTRLPELVTDDAPVRVVIRRMAEMLQSEPDMLAHLHECGVRPGLEVTARRGGLGVLLTLEDGRELELSLDAAAHLYVVAM